jgi:hypothetical protein
MSPRPTHLRAAGALPLALLVAALCSGCSVTLYQPLVSLQQPAVVDPQAPNFEGLKLLVRCHPGDYLLASDAQRLCRNVGMLFRNQGAEVDTEIPRGRGADEDREHDLVVDLSARLLHTDSSTALVMLSGITFTLIPTFAEHTFAQEITIRDASGFLLAQDSVQARFIEYNGVGIWTVNWLADRLVRADEDELTGARASLDFSRDFHARLSQLAFNAHMRSTVLKGFGD